MVSNASINLSSDYYENIGSGVTFNDIAQEYIDSITDLSEKRSKEILLRSLIDSQRINYFLNTSQYVKV